MRRSGLHLQVQLFLRLLSGFLSGSNSGFDVGPHRTCLKKDAIARMRDVMQKICGASPVEWVRTSGRLLVGI